MKTKLSPGQIEDGYLISKMLHECGGMWYANNIARKLGISTVRVRHGLAAVRRELCPPYKIPAAQSGGGFYQVTVSDDFSLSHADVGLKCNIDTLETRLKHVLDDYKALAAKETNPAMQEYYLKMATTLNVAAMIVEQKPKAA